MAFPKPESTPNLGTPGREYRYVHPSRLMMWLYIIATVMIFAGWTSAVLVSSADWERSPAGWEGLPLPDAFTWTTLVVVLSSVFMQFSFWAAKRDKTLLVGLGIVAGLGLGIVFLYGQFTGFQELITRGIFLSGMRNPSGSFLYVIALMHGLHLVAAILAGLYFTIKALNGRLKPGQLMGFELLLTFWHALGVLWVYLFVFLSYVYN